MSLLKLCAMIFLVDLTRLFLFSFLFLLYYSLVVDFLACLAGSTTVSNVRASQLLNARGRKLIVQSTASKSTQTKSLGSSASSSVTSVHSRVGSPQQSQPAIMQAPSTAAAPAQVTSVVTSTSSNTLKDRTLFQRLFQR